MSFSAAKSNPSKSLDPSTVFFGPREKPTEISVNPQPLAPKKDGSSYCAPKKSLSALYGGKWRPKPFVEKKTEGEEPKTKEKYDSSAKTFDPKGLAQPKFFGSTAIKTARGNVEKAEGEVASAKAEYEKYDNTAKAYKAMGSPKAKVYESKALTAKKKYEQKLTTLHTAEKKLASTLGKPGAPKSGLAVGGEALSGPTGATLAKQHSTLSAG